jgi:hypothetical protein
LQSNNNKLVGTAGRREWPPGSAKEVNRLPARIAATADKGAETMKKTPLASAISSILAAGTLSASGAALAQAQSNDVADDTPVEEVVVTGSRIRKDVFTSSAPMEVIDVDKGM